MSPSRIWRQLSVWIRIRARGRSDHTVKLTEICMHQLVLSNTKLQSIAVCLAHTGRSCKCDTELCKTNVPSNRSSQRSHLQLWISSCGRPPTLLAMSSINIVTLCTLCSSYWTGTPQIKHPHVTKTSRTEWLLQSSTKCECEYLLGTSVL